MTDRVDAVTVVVERFAVDVVLVVVVERVEVDVVDVVVVD